MSPEVYYDTFFILNEALEDKRSGIQEKVLAWSMYHTPRYPWRKMGKSPYEVLVGELALERAPLSAVSVYDELIQHFPSFKAMLHATEEDLCSCLSRHGLQSCAGQMKTVLESLAREGKGNMPGDSYSLLKITGLGNHSVRAIMCFGHGLPVAVVDSHVLRMLSRLFTHSLPPSPAPTLIEAIGEALPPGRNTERYNCALLDLSELVCRLEAAQCSQCPVIQLCDFGEAKARVRSKSLLALR